MKPNFRKVVVHKQLMNAHGLFANIALSREHMTLITAFINNQINKRQTTANPEINRGRNSNATDVTTRRQVPRDQHAASVGLTRWKKWLATSRFRDLTPFERGHC